MSDSIERNKVELTLQRTRKNSKLNITRSSYSRRKGFSFRSKDQSEQSLRDVRIPKHYSSLGRTHFQITPSSQKISAINNTHEEQ
jgi:hypothetical protein